MRRQRFFLLLVAALVALTGALYLAARRNPTVHIQDPALFPSLSTDLDAVSAVIVRKSGAGATTTLQKTPQGWTVAERANYPADVTKLRMLLSALAEAMIVEQKTSDSGRYAVIGVEDLSQAGASGTEITITSHGVKRAVIVGKSAGQGSFVRREGEPQSYSVEPAVSTDAEPHDWIDSRLIDVPLVKIQSVEYKPVGGAVYSIHRVNPEGAFSLEGLPAGRKPLDAASLAPASTAFSGLTAEDVSSLDAADFNQAFSTVVTLTDGQVITLAGVINGTKHWVRVQAGKDPALAAKFEGRAFEVASYRYDAIFKPLEQLLLPKTPKPG